MQDIPNIDNALITEINNWLASNPDKWPDYQRDEKGKILNPPDLLALEKHNEQGLSIAHKVKELIAYTGIKVTYLYVSPDDFKTKQIRNVKSLAMN